MKTLSSALKPGGRLSLCFRPPEVAAVLGLDKAGFNTVKTVAEADRALTIPSYGKTHRLLRVCEKSVGIKTEMNRVN